MSILHKPFDKYRQQKETVLGCRLEKRGILKQNKLDLLNMKD